MRLLRALAFRDIDDDADAISRPPVPIARERGGEIGPDHLAVLAKIPLLHGEARDLAGKHAATQAQIGGEVRGVGKLLEIALQELVAPAAEDAAELVVDAEEAAIGTEELDTDSGEIEGRAQRLLDTRRADATVRGRKTLPFRTKRIGGHVFGPHRSRMLRFHLGNSNFSEKARCAATLLGTGRKLSPRSAASLVPPARGGGSRPHHLQKSPMSPGMPPG
jgi:hypothetical protein